MTVQAQKQIETLESRLVREGLLSLIEAAQAVPSRGGGRAGTTTVWRWAAHGRRVGSQVLRLEGFRLPNGDWVTSAPALGRFFAAVNLARSRRRKPAPAPSANASWANEVLERAGA